MLTHVNIRLRSEAVALAQETMGQKRYGKYSYLYHLSMVESVLMSAGVELTGELGKLLIAAWLHDFIEDTGGSYNDIKNQFDMEIAEMVLAVTNDIRGRNRHERHMSVVPALQKNPMARVLKLADRYANMSASNEGMSEKYVKEYYGFRTDLHATGSLSTGKLAEVEMILWAALDKLVKFKEARQIQVDDVGYQGAY